MPSAVAAPSTLYDKVLRDHTVDEKDDGTILLYIGALQLLLMNVVAVSLIKKSRPPPGARGDVSGKICCSNPSSPTNQQLLIEPLQQAFEGLKTAGRKVRRPDCTLATSDHVSSSSCLTLPVHLRFQETSH